MDDPQASAEAAPQKPKPRKKGGWFKTSCLGCLGLGALLIGGTGLMFLVAVIQGPPENIPTDSELSHALPGSGPDVPLDSIAPSVGESPEGTAVGARRASARPGTIHLDLTMGKFEIVAGPPGVPIRVEACYDAGAFKLTEEFDAGGEAGWTYKLSFGNRVSMIRQMLAGTNPGNNHIRLVIPRDVPIAISGRVGLGESTFELGGLWLTDLALKVGIGQHRVSFKEPTREPVEEIYVRASIGEFGIRGLGNASPRKATITQSLGESTFDLRGEWRRDGSVALSCGVGECSVRLPRDDVNLVVDRASLMIGESHTRAIHTREPAPGGAPTVTVSMSQTLGEMNMR